MVTGIFFFFSALQITSYTSFTYPPTLLDVPLTTLPEETPSLTPCKYLTQAEKQSFSFLPFTLLVFFNQKILIKSILIIKLTQAK